MYSTCRTPTAPPQNVTARISKVGLLTVSNETNKLLFKSLGDHYLKSYPLFHYDGPPTSSQNLLQKQHFTVIFITTSLT